MEGEVRVVDIGLAQALDRVYVIIFSESYVATLWRYLTSSTIFPEKRKKKKKERKGKVGGKAVATNKRRGKLLM